MYQGYVFTTSKLRRLQVYEGHLKASSSSDQPNWPGCEGCGGGERQAFSQTQLSMEKKEKKRKAREGERQRGRVAVFPLAWQQSSNNIYFFFIPQICLFFANTSNATVCKRSENYLLLRKNVNITLCMTWIRCKLQLTQLLIAFSRSFLSPWKWDNIIYSLFWVGQGPTKVTWFKRFIPRDVFKTYFNHFLKHLSSGEFDSKRFDSFEHPQGLWWLWSVCIFMKHFQGQFLPQLSFFPH